MPFPVTQPFLALNMPPLVTRLYQRYANERFGLICTSFIQSACVNLAPDRVLPTTFDRPLSLDTKEKENILLPGNVDAVSV